MLSKILLNYKKEVITHPTSDDIESLIYVLVWMCILYAGPGTLRKDKHVTQTVLKPWVTVSSETDAVSLGAHKAGLKSQLSIVTDEFTVLFQPLCPTVHKLLTKLGELSATDHISNYRAIRNILLEGFATVEEVSNWSAAKDVHGYSLLQQNTKHKLPSYATNGYKAEEDGARPRDAHRHQLI